MISQRRTGVDPQPTVDFPESGLSFSLERRRAKLGFCTADMAHRRSVETRNAAFTIIERSTPPQRVSARRVELLKYREQTGPDTEIVAYHVPWTKIASRTSLR